MVDSLVILSGIDDRIERVLIKPKKIKTLHVPQSELDDVVVEAKPAELDVDTRPLEPDTTLCDATDVLHEPEATFNEPEISINEPEVTFNEPDISFSEPDISFNEPEVSFQEPEDSFTEPEGPFNEHTVPLNGPEGPHSYPRDPFKEPENPVKEPEIPVKESKVPGNESKNSFSESKVPFEEPKTPFDESKAPFKEPKAPFDESNVPFKEPKAPFDESNVPFKEPKAPFDESKAPFDESKVPFNEPHLPFNEPQLNPFINPSNTHDDEPVKASRNPLHDDNAKQPEKADPGLSGNKKSDRNSDINSPRLSDPSDKPWTTFDENPNQIPDIGRENDGRQRTAASSQDNKNINNPQSSDNHFSPGNLNKNLLNPATNGGVRDKQPGFSDADDRNNQNNTQPSHGSRSPLRDPVVSSQPRSHSESDTPEGRSEPDGAGALGLGAGAQGPSDLDRSRTSSQSSLADTASLIPKRGQWSTGLCQCNDCCGEVCYPWMCLPCATYHLAQSIGHTDAHGPLCCIQCHVGDLRSRLRHKFGILGSDDTDCCISYWCTPCAMGQMNREIRIRENQ